jgi:hypothetical protein
MIVGGRGCYTYTPSATSSPKLALEEFFSPSYIDFGSKATSLSQGSSGGLADTVYSVNSGLTLSTCGPLCLDGKIFVKGPKYLARKTLGSASDAETVPTFER